MTKLTFRCIVLFTLICGLSTKTYAQWTENETQLRVGVDLNWSIVKNLKFNVAPEVRFDEGFEVNQYQLEAGLRYKTFGFIYWDASYRFELYPVKYYPYEDDHRYAFSVTAREKYGRFTPSLRVQYTNYIDEDVASREYLRYRAMVKYDIDNFKLTPYVSAEAFHWLGDNVISKMRYTAGAEYKLDQALSIEANYKLDYECIDYKNRHIFCVGFNVNF